jgi:hypothetical protein
MLMKLRALKAIYFATICLPPPLLLVLYPMVFIWHVKFPMALITYYPFYFWIGFVLLIIDLWCSKYPKNVKVRWSILNTILGIICLPIYWFRYVLSK